MKEDRKKLHLKLRRKYHYRTKNNWKGKYLILTRVDNNKDFDIEFVVGNPFNDKISVYINDRTDGNYSIARCDMTIDELDTVYQIIKKSIEEVQ